MTKKTAKKIGLIASISVLISAVIGIGIFFKNGTVFENNNNNGVGVLISWILAAVTAFATAFSFCEIGFGNKRGAGLAGSVEEMYGKKFGRFINFNQSFFYAGILNICIAIFSAEALFNVFMSDEQKATTHVAFVFLVALGLLAVFLVFNYFSTKWSSRCLVVATFLKFLPLIIVGLAGIIFGAMHPENSLFGATPGGVIETTVNGVTTTEPVVKVGPISVQGILSSLPAILFAFDSFLSVGNIKYEMKEPRKQVPATMVIGMCICIAFYLLVTIGQILTSAGIAVNVFQTINNITPGSFSEKALTGFKIFINVFILIAILGVLNAITLAYLRAFEQCVHNRIFYGYWLFSTSAKHDRYKAGLILSILIYFFWWLLLFIPSVVLNSDVFVDGLSNFPTLFMFFIYGTVVLKGIINRAQKKPNAEKVKGFLVFAPIAVIGCYLAFGYQFFYYFSISTFITPYATINWGLFFSHGLNVQQWQGAIWFFFAIIMFVCVPFLNDALLKAKYNKINKTLQQCNVKLINSEYIKELMV